jgi:TRAP-type C4-dicarboxylate transport system permease large subunit
LDTTVTLARRIWIADRWFESHREHFYQRLVRAGKSHSFVTEWECILQIIVLITVIAAIKMGWPQRIAAAGAVFALWAGLFAFAEFQFKKRSNSRPAS